MARAWGDPKISYIKFGHWALLSFVVFRPPNVGYVPTKGVLGLSLLRSDP